MRQCRPVRVLAMMAALTLLMTACGGDDPGGADPEPSPAASPAEGQSAQGDGLVLGALLPQTGQLASIGEGMIAGTEMAVADMNDAGGVLGSDVELLQADEGDQAATVQQSADRLVAEGAHGIIGAASSGQSLEVIEQITGSDVLQCSGSNTSPTFTQLNNELYFRTAPSDELQGPVLADLIVEQGYADVGIMARADDYGQGLAQATATALEDAGATVVAEEIYDPEAATFEAEVSSMQDAGAGAVVLISFDEGANILGTMIESGMGPDEIGIFGADGLRNEGLPEEVQPGNPDALNGMWGTAANPSADEDFIERLQEFAGGDLEDTIYAAQKYDCSVLMGLAAIATDSTAASDMAEEVPDLVNGDNECTSFEECAEMLRDGESIAYRGPSGVTELTEAGDPVSGNYEIWRFQEGELVQVETRDASMQGGSGS